MKPTLLQDLFGCLGLLATATCFSAADMLSTRHTFDARMLGPSSHWKMYTC